MTLYFGKFSTRYPEQFENKYYAGGKEGSDWDGCIKKDDTHPLKSRGQNE